VAVANTLTRSAAPLATLVRAASGTDWSVIAGLIEEWKPARLVVGVPYNADGTETELGREAARFARRLEGRFGVPTVTLDEQLSSAEAEARLRDARSGGTRRRRVGKEDVDRVAAAVILQSWLDNHD
jgi:putative Holliday junction resolvase